MIWYCQKLFFSLFPPLISFPISKPFDFSSPRFAYCFVLTNSALLTALKNLLSWGSIVRKSNLTLNPFLDVWHVGQIADDRQTGEAKVEGLETEEGHDVAGTSARSAVDEHDGNRQ